ncbi:MAG: GNAT family N-acetyltransferase [Opitutae bacterium]|nr:GNAT family N-acetyltransferase [Opitutae bacterium]
MRLHWSFATTADAGAIATLRNAASDALTAKHGFGWWSGHGSAKGVLPDLRDAKILLGTHRGLLLATLRLTTRKPWAIDRAHFTPVQRPLFLTSLAVDPAHQRRGLGRQAMAEARRLAEAWPADALLLDAFDHPGAGAGAFYAKCGYREVARVTYRKARLIYYELPLSRTE